MNKRWLFNLSLIVFCTLPFVNLFVKNYFIMTNGEKTRLLITISALIIISFLIIFSEEKLKYLKLKYFSVLIFILFNYLSITDFAYSNFPPIITKIDNYAFYFYTICFFSIFIVALKLFEKQAFQSFLSVFVILSLISPIFTFINETSENNLDVSGIEKGSLVEFKSTPDVYFIIFDGMANYRTLNEYYNYDISKSYDELENSDYRLSKNSVSAYGQSRPTIASILNLDYVFPEGEVSFNNRKLLLEEYLSVNSIVYETFDKNNYEFFITGEDLPCNPDVHHCINHNSGDTFLYSLLINTPYSILVNNREKIPNIYKSINKFLNIDCSPDCREINFKEIQEFIKFNEDSKKPNFVLIHNMNTHFPFRVDENCKTLNDTKFGYSYFNKNEFIDTNLCNVSELVYLSKNTSKDSIIVAQSDHGPFYKKPIYEFDNLSIDDIKNRYLIFSSSKNIDNTCPDTNNENSFGVNTFRIIFNCLSGTTKYELLKIKSFYASYGAKTGEINYGFDKIIQITQQINKILNVE